MSSNEPGGMPPEWILSLTRELTPHFTATPFPSPMGVHVQKSLTDAEGDVWEVSLFYGKTEIYGGPQDGHRTDTAFWLDLSGLQATFDVIDGFYWQSAGLGSDDDFGPHIGIDGVYRNHPVRLRLLAAAPQAFPAARAANPLSGTFLDLW